MAFTNDFPAALLIGVLFTLSLAFLAGAPTFTATSVSTTITVATYVETSSNESSVTFGTLDPLSTNKTASSNPLNFTNTVNSNTAIDIYLNATNFWRGGAATDNITNDNLSVTLTYNATATYRSFYSNGTYLMGAGPDAAYVENLAAKASQLLYFNLTVPGGQTAGAYTNTLTLKAMADGGTP